MLGQRLHGDCKRTNMGHPFRHIPWRLRAQIRASIACARCKTYGRRRVSMRRRCFLYGWYPQVPGLSVGKVAWEAVAAWGAIRESPSGDPINCGRANYQGHTRDRQRAGGASPSGAGLASARAPSPTSPQPVPLATPPSSPRQRLPRAPPAAPLQRLTAPSRI